jgi:hypothetical protein
MIEALSTPGVKRSANPVGKRLEGSNVTEVELQRDRSAAECFDLRDGGLSLALAAAVGEDHVAIVAGDADSGIAAKATTAAGNDGNGGHWSVLSWCLMCRQPADGAVVRLQAVRPLAVCGSGV